MRIKASAREDVRQAIDVGASRERLSALNKHLSANVGWGCYWPASDAVERFCGFDGSEGIVLPRCALGNLGEDLVRFDHKVMRLGVTFQHGVDPGDMSLQLGVPQASCGEQSHEDLAARVTKLNVFGNLLPQLAPPRGRKGRSHLTRRYLRAI